MADDPLRLDGRRLLIVEDTFAVAQALAWDLGSYGSVDVEMAASRQAALEKVNAESFDGALLDVNLAGESVGEVAERLQAQAVPFVFITGYDDESLLGDRFAGVPRFLKPVDSEQVVRKLNELMQERPG